MDIITPVVLDGYAPRKDGSFSIRFVTQEQTPEQVANIHTSLGAYGFLVFKKDPQGFRTFDEFYKYRTEKIIDALKKQLDEVDI